jgi:HAD superfamily hydrolase (TIGR01450 family)
VEGAEQLLKRLEKAGKKVLFLTNNSSKSLEQYKKKIAGLLGYDAKDDQIISSATSAINYIKNHHADKKIYLEGTQSLKNDFEESGIKLVNDDPDVAVFGYNNKIDFEKIASFCDFLRFGAFFVATHSDINCPTNSKSGTVPDIGSMLAMIKASTERDPDIICGKPFAPMYEVVKKHINCPPEKVAMIGDRLYTDIGFGNANGFTTILVLTGEATRETAANLQNKPTFVLDSVAEIKI